MIVVSDTTPLNYLILIDAVSVLPAVFGRVSRFSRIRWRRLPATD